MLYTSYERKIKMRAGFIERAEVAYYKDVEEPVLENASDVKIQVKATGICGSEVHAYHGKHPYRIPPVVSGHEFAGVVVEVGKGVRRCKVGDRVTAEPQYGCGSCPACKAGKYNICSQKKVLGSGGWSGSFGEYIVVPEQTIVPLSDSVSYEQGALIEPIAVGMHAVRKNHVSIDDTILIIGAGTIGLGLLLSVMVCNPRCVGMADVVDYNLEIARQMGCTYVINNQKENLEEKIKEITDGQGADITFLAFGNASVVEEAAKCTKRGGIVSEIALMPNGEGAPYALIQAKEIAVIGSNMYTYDDYMAVMDCISKGVMDTSLLVTHRYPIEQMKEAMEMADKRPEPVIKVMMSF